MREGGLEDVDEDEAQIPGEHADPEPPDDDEAADEPPPPAAVVAEAEAALQAAEQRVQQLEAEGPTLAAVIDAAREQVLGRVQRQLAGKEARWRGYWPAADEGHLQALQEEVRAQASAYRQARRAADQLTQRLAVARQQVYECRQALSQAQHEARVREQAPELWARLRRAIRARDTDPDLNNYREPGLSIRARARHQQAIEAIEREIAGVLQTAGVA